MASIYSEVRADIQDITQGTSPTLVRIDNVSDWINSQPKDWWDLRYDIGTLLSPWPCAWYEWAHFDGIAITGQNGSRHPATIACLVTSYTVTPTPIVTRSDWVGLVSKFSRSDESTNWDQFDFTSNGDARYMQMYFGFLRARGVTGGLKPLLATLNAQGLPTGSLMGLSIKLPVRPLWQKQDQQGNDAFAEDGTLLPVHLACAFMSCKNVAVVDEHPNLRHAYNPKGRHTIGTRWHILTIGGITKVLEDKGKSRSDGIKRALHICRGHFGNYTEGRGLFGKYHGKFWIPAHVRGNAAEGRIEKGYKVLAPSPKEG